MKETRLANLMMQHGQAVFCIFNIHFHFKTLPRQTVTLAFCYHIVLESLKSFLFTQVND